MNFKFKNAEVIVKIFSEVIETTKNPSDLIEAEVILNGEKAQDYPIGSRVLVRRDNLRDLNSPLFQKDIKIVQNQLGITCQISS